MKPPLEVEVEFTVECDDFAVPEWIGLRCSATFEVFGHVTFDRSGDSVTPNGPPRASVALLDPKSYGIHLVGPMHDIDVALPDWLQYMLATEKASEFDAAFLAAIGGQERLETLAIEKASE